MTYFAHLTNAMVFQPVPEGTDQLTLEIYAQLLDHFICDMQMEHQLALMARPAPLAPTQPNPWAPVNPLWPNDPYFYGPPYKVTCNAQTTAVK